MKQLNKCFSAIAACVVALISLSACNNTTSYADLLKDETKSINRFLADQKVEGSVPADSIFVTGNDAPFYRMDEDGTVYMQVVRKGDMSERPQYNDLVYMRYTRYNLDLYEDGKLPDGSGNSSIVTESTSFRYQNQYSLSTQTWGEGLQVPLGYLGYGCEVNMVVRSSVGPAQEISLVVPYLYNVRYYKSQL